MQQHIQERVLLEKGGGEAFQVFDQAVVDLCPVHGEVKAVFIAGNIFFIQQINILDMPVIKDKIMNFTGFIDNGVTGFIQISFHKTIKLFDSAMVFV